MVILTIFVIGFFLFGLPPILMVVFYWKHAKYKKAYLQSGNADEKLKAKYNDYQLMAIAMAVITAIVWIPILIC